LKALVSHTVLAEAIASRDPVYVESIIGHQWEKQASILAARIFSLSCVPLISANRVFGALFLHTRRPGRVIARDSLDALKIVATHTALLLSQRKESTLARGKSAVGEGAKAIVFDNASADPMQTIIERIDKLAPHDLSILIRGETGVGKELVAKALHEKSPRASGPFVAVNCAAVPPTLMESILFGHAKGAFTGADKARPGKFEQADKGTLFLDEIGDLSAELQAKLLRALQEKEVEPVGAVASRPIDIRVLAATHQDIEALVRAGKFRKDLYFRLAGATIVLPPLRDRGPGAIERLAKHFLARFSSSLHFSREALDALVAHQWPGNVRQLEQVVSRAVALSSDEEIPAAVLELEEAMAADEATHANSALGVPMAPLALREGQQRFAKDLLRQTLQRHGGNRQRTAEALGVSERTLYRMLAAAGSEDCSGIRE
jgi:two-component system response regulator HydG